MRQAQGRYLKPQPLLTKKQPSVTAHIDAPIKGLSLQNKRTPGDPGTATILKNFVIEDDRIECRAGYRKIVDTTSNAIIWHLVPHYGLGRLLAATNNSLIEVFSGSQPGVTPVVPPVVVQAGFTGNDWHWTSFSNLGEEDYTVMVNGKDGVWSWNGLLTTDPAAVDVVKISDAIQAVVTVAAGDIGKFRNGQTVTITGVPVGTTGIVNANGSHMIANVGVPANTFTLVNVDTSTATADYSPTAGVVSVNPPGSIGKEAIAVPDDAKWINPNQFHIVLSHMNRLWFADPSHQAIYYLPIQQKGTEVSTGEGRLRHIPLNVYFTRGGTIRALATWTLDGGRGMEDMLVVFSTNGEAVIWSGTDPNSDFTLKGIYHFDSPMSKHSVINYGGDCFAFVSTGMVPLSTMLRAEAEQLGQADRAVISTFLKDAIQNRANFGWQAFLNPSTQRVFCNIPQGPNRYKQMVRHMPRPVWSEFESIPARCWAWIDPYVYFGDDRGNVYEMHPTHQSDDGKAITVDVQFHWSQFKTTNLKHFKFVKAHVISDGLTRPYLGMRLDYKNAGDINRPDISASNDGSAWDLAEWNVALWAPGSTTVTNWTGVASRMAATGAVRLSADIKGCTFGVAGIDVMYEVGSPM